MFTALLKEARHRLLKSLQEEYEYQASEEAIVATIEANEYWVTADGKNSHPHLTDGK